MIYGLLGVFYTTAFLVPHLVILIVKKLIAQFADSLKSVKHMEHEETVQINFREIKVKYSVAYNPITGK